MGEGLVEHVAHVAEAVVERDRTVDIEDHRAAMPVPQVEPRPHHAAVG